ncbi:MAG: hypothetical protein N2486_08405 [Caloramator sp.]|nr:hypothetical protein [Caloramator sp.]
MPEIVYRTVDKKYNTYELGKVVCKELGTSTIDVLIAFASFGISTVVGAFAGGLPGLAFSLGISSYTIQDIQNIMDKAKLTRQIEYVFTIMKDRSDKGLKPGCAKVIYEHRVWVSSNGEQWSGEYYVPVKVEWVIN